MKKLVLFDIDGTLVLTGGAGMRAMNDAFEDVFGVTDAIAGVVLAGRTDRAIFEDMRARHAPSPVAADGLTDGLAERFRRRYLARLSTEIVRPLAGKRVLPGVRPLLETLARRDDIELALLTGNYEEGAEIKLSHFDLWDFFGWGAFGGDVVDRNLLLTRALLQARERGIRPRSPGDVVVIGDTPYDVACAHSGGARAVAVATGPCSVDDLRATGAEVVLADLGDATAFLAAIE